MRTSAGAANGIGQPVRRKEDFRLLTGRGRYGDDLALPRMVHAAFVRSPHAHARIRSMDKTTALAVPGALAVLAGADYVADGLKPIPHNAGLVEPPDLVVRLCGMDPIAPPHWPLPIEKARFVGEGVAMVVAESIAAAKDMAERVHVDYEPLPAVSRAVEAIKPGAPVLWDEAPDNLCIDIEAGDAAATSAAFARAAHIVRLDTWVHRVTGVPLEPRTTVAAYDPASKQYTLYSGSGRGVAKARLDLADALGVPAERVRVLCEEMGGSFGTRNLFYPEWTLLAWVAHRIGRPVKWTCERSESFLSDYQGRDLRVEAELALDADGTFLAVRSSHLSNLGAYAATFVPLQKGMGILSAVYHIPVAFVRGRGAFTNTAPTAPYRSAGRLALDPVALRQRNLIRSAAQPYTNPLGLTYDSGDYEQVMERALALADW